MACVKTTSRGIKTTIPDPAATPNAHEYEGFVFCVGAGIQLILCIALTWKSAKRADNSLSDVFHTLFFLFGCLGYGFYGYASFAMVAGENVFTVLSKLSMVASWASLLLNGCCLLETFLPQRLPRILFGLFSIVLIVAALTGAVLPGGYMLMTYSFLTVMCFTCAVSWALAAYLGRKQQRYQWAYTAKAMGAAMGSVALLTAAILEPICGYSAHSPSCYEGCEMPSVHVLMLLVLLLLTWLLLALQQSRSPDDAAIPKISRAPPPREVVPTSQLPNA